MSNTYIKRTNHRVQQREGRGEFSFLTGWWQKMSFSQFHLTLMETLVPDVELKRPWDGPVMSPTEIILSLIGPVQIIVVPKPNSIPFSAFRKYWESITHWKHYEQDQLRSSYSSDSFWMWVQPVQTWPDLKLCPLWRLSFSRFTDDVLNLKCLYFDSEKVFSSTATSIVCPV